MTLQLQAATNLWSAQSGRIGGNSALQQNAADPAENGHDLSADFAAAMQQSQTVQQQLAAAPAEQESVSTSGSGLNNGQSTQNVSGSSQTSGSAGKEANSEQSSEQAQKFLDGLMEQLLANRLGLNKKEMDRLKEKIAELELKRKELMAQASQGGDSAKLTTAIAQMDTQISQLQKQLEQLIREYELAKNNPDDDKRREWSAQSLGQSLDQAL
ncbi:MAG: hypothetical protein U5L02_16175 [Rheinheimera sp.]|nr:hypothetical protein [Rheinheimera sp.]